LTALIIPLVDRFVRYIDGLFVCYLVSVYLLGYLRVISLFFVTNLVTLFPSWLVNPSGPRLFLGGYSITFTPHYTTR